MMSILRILVAYSSVRSAFAMEAWAVVTGASSGIGRSLALEAAARGFSVAIAARNKSALDALATDIRARGVKVLPVVVDLASDAGASELHQATAHLGSSIELVMINAGVASAGDVVTSSSAITEQLLSLNTISVARQPPCPRQV